MALTAGLKTDFENLLLRFQQTESVRYEEFSTIWRDMKFSTIFYGKMGITDGRKFTKAALALASQYFFPPYSFQIRFGGLYLLYGLYNTQLCQPKEKIRVALKDWDEVLSCQEEMVNAEHFDAVYVLKKLLNDRAFHFTAMPTLLAYNKKKRKTPNDTVNEGFREKSNLVSELITVDVLEELMNIHEHYQTMKRMISANKTQLDKALSLIRGDFVSELKNVTVEFQQWQMNKSTMTDQPGILGSEYDEEQKGINRAQTLANIKSKSYNSTVKAPRSRRHRQIKLESSESGSDWGRMKKPPSRNSSVKDVPAPKKRRRQR
ncbi:snRNA-activating protein complex subunit 1b [Scyliorhinus canicula]|uniref:snRNA-activating protein complex subunit 1b n=1 Tax=Scyliorhinus canicula TaxID=7830 RepID=UPI0018F3CD24|nr:snRNA-activating protein complex subunit 1b [Scyliorhinus canicula]XP_038631351.1 snRNA-activating protein complex subunit 1b [Scyliorhinus canicula]XP_038631358.1 snRNA-activating protein complex subunit 1b [Scyliorhinus canicula]XP_038631366.1 snRNA-activating protein complex subunit 1b [Scyliorhinus canicula]XP_038631375.1 snRNA-activating protein complex subunit 1b [Scyliorhinus canicula]XP_038631383.1 snRNA-activating protein complex subunit 1b [Scyliorhinus canicula]XP_038631391.1 sn